MIEIIIGAIFLIFLLISLYIWIVEMPVILFIFAVIAIILCPILALLNIFPYLNMIIIFIVMGVSLYMSLGYDEW